MPVVIKYVVERDGVEIMTFTSKKEADAYDKMLDIAENLESLLSHIEVPLSEQQSESLALEMAKKKDDFMAVLKGSTSKPENKTKKAETNKSDETDKDNVTQLKNPA